jgi:tetratricopeptide (TPR) repeat protein
MDADGVTDSTPAFPDYGERGDRAGARRARHAFWLCVAACVVITGILWFTDKYLRHDHADRLYMSAITMNPQSARVLLLQAIKVDEESGEKPTPRYTQALAVRRELDVIVETYEKAYQLDPKNSLFALRYGTQLFQFDDFAKAGEIFREAALHPPENALPSYLEAACVAKASEGLEAVENAMVALTRANKQAKPVIFPKPIWMPSTLPESGEQYARLSRGIADDVCAPLNHFANQVLDIVGAQRAEGRSRGTKRWLAELKLMGERLAEQSEPRYANAARLGLDIQAKVIKLLRTPELNDVELKPEAKDELVKADIHIDDALEEILDFERGRDDRVAAGVESVWYPNVLYGYGALWVFGVYLFARILCRLSGARKSVSMTTQGPLGMGAVVGGMLLLFVLMHALRLSGWVQIPDTSYERTVALIWWLVLGGLLLFGFVYPALSLKSTEEVSRRAGHPDEVEGTLRLARGAYRRAYLSLALRYQGMLLGLYICLYCAWMVSFRVSAGLYPLQINLLAPGLLEEEARRVALALAKLG